MNTASKTAPFLSTAQWRQLGWITAGAVAIFAGFRLLPTGTSLSHMDFRAGAKNAIEFCDPANPQFIPVVAVPSPVAMTVSGGESALVAGRRAQLRVTLATRSGKPIGPEDLVYAHTRRLHLLLVDASLQDYQHVHPEPGARRGDWEFAFTPQLGGGYRVFADFTPAATMRGLYAAADLPGAGRGAAVAPETRGSGTVERGGLRFELRAVKSPVRAREPADFQFSVERVDGAPIALEPVMDALAHLVAFDAARSGFAHLHPARTDLDARTGATRPVLNFKITIPKPGRYVIWAQVHPSGSGEMFVPFWFDVAP
ncbi:MAG: hypothetical protein HY736_13685 [Verrucomicrobia bacterium]|nr:hypothetical protein [Verrucomicrobiota bacterium]